jgi:hypothetical protein
MNAARRALILVFLLLPAGLRAQGNSPHAAYVYPAGARQGAVLQVTVGGQYLGAVSNAVLSGPDVQAVVVALNRPMNQKEFNDLRDELKKLQDKRQSWQRSPGGTNAWTSSDEARIKEIRDKILRNPPNRQANPAMAETAIVRITLATNAEPGARELRLQTPNALSNPLKFYVGQLTEYSKAAARPANPDLARFLAQLGGEVATNNAKSEMRITLPSVVNGQIMPGAVDRCRFTARAGQQIIVSVGARALIPYLADAVPGWFEATATLYDAKGNELAYDDRFRFRPDPLLHFTAPKTGEYFVEIKDSIYRGREDFVYRMTIGELPCVTDIFPLGGPAGGRTTVQLDGWNLTNTEQTVDNTERKPGIYSISAAGGEDFSDVPFAVDSLPECLAHPSNNSLTTAQPVTLPIIINGRIDSPGRESVFRFEGKAGEPIVAEVMARRLGSPLDSTVELADANGRQLAFNDDFDDKGSGLETHHADSYLLATLPADGTYFVRLRDAEQQGGPQYSYRLRISEPRPDFALRVTPSSVNVRAGMSAPVTVYALRKDGFTNTINLGLRDAPAGFSLSGAKIAGNQDKAQFTLKAPPQFGTETVALRLEGSAVVSGRVLEHEAVPSEDMMQAFAYRHLVPSRELRVAVAENPHPFASSTLRIVSATPVKIPMGGSARVRVATPSSAFADRFDLQLDNAPPGVSIKSVAPSEGGIELLLDCDKAGAKPGSGGNLIVNMVPRAPPAAPSQAPARPQRRNPVGTLPAIPFEIVPE